MLAAAEGQVDLAFTADDIAGQNGLLMSTSMWETFLKPYHVRLNAAIHEFGVKVIYHTDGAATESGRRADRRGHRRAASPAVQRQGDGPGGAQAPLWRPALL